MPINYVKSYHAWHDHNVRRGPLAAIALVAGCLQPSSHQCAGGWACPASLACGSAAPYCGDPRQVARCDGQPEWSACAYDGSNPDSGSCRGGVCEMCDQDRAGCTFTGWKPMTPASMDLDAVWVGSISEAYVGGQNGTLLHYNGIDWQPVDDGLPANATVTSIWGSGPSDVYVVANDAAHTLTHFDGTAWSSVALPVSGVTLKAVSGVSSDLVFAVGAQGTVVTRANGAWSGTTMTLPGTLSAVSATGDHDVFVVGTAGQLAHYDGAMWKVDAMPDSAYAGADLQGVWATGPGRAVAIGLRIPNAPSATLVEYAPSAWAELYTGTQSSLYGVWGAGSSALAVGEMGALFVFDGTGWSAQPPLGTSELHAISGSAPNNIMVVGTGGTILRYTGE